MHKSQNLSSVLNELKSLSTKDVQKVAERRGVPVNRLLGVSTADIRKLAKGLGEDESLAESLWSSEVHEARLLATLIFPEQLITRKQLDRWVRSVNSWGICDQFAKNLASRLPDVTGIVVDWANDTAPYVRRAALAVIANYCMKSSEITAVELECFLSVIQLAASDDHQHVKQGNCWALRELGKINDGTHEQAIHVALQLRESEDRMRAWVGRCAYKELELLIRVPERRRLISRKSKTAAKYKYQ